MHGIHCRLVALISQVTDGVGMVGHEGIVMQVSASDGGTEVFGESCDFGVSITHADTTTGEDDGVLGIGNEVSGFRKSVVATGRVGLFFRSADDVLVFSIEEIARNVDLDWATFV